MRPCRLLALVLLTATLSGCSDVGLGLVALDLEITVLSGEGAPVAGAAVWLQDHGLPAGTDPVKRRHQVCTTNTDGKCAGVVEYTYSVRRWPWEKTGEGRTAADRFELSVQRGDQSEFLGFLPPLTSAQLHGAEPVSYKGTVESAPRTAVVRLTSDGEQVASVEYSAD